MAPIDLDIHAEDKTLVAIGERIIGEFGDKFRIIGKPQFYSGSGNIARWMPNFNQAAHCGNVRLVLMDMDSLAYPQDKKSCPESKIRQMLKNQSPNLLLRIAVYEAESWLMADWDAWKKFFKISGPKPTVDGLINAKSQAKKMIRRNNPNKRLNFDKLRYDFIKEKWRPKKAVVHSKSLRQTLERLKSFRV